jgi:hypothetical protein
MLLVSSWSFDPNEPFEDGLELPRKKFFKLLESRGDFGAVNGENPDGGFAVRIIGGLAASSSKDSSSTKSRKEGCSYAP